MVQPPTRDLAIGVHTHAMPMLVLCRLADLRLADFSGTAEGIIRLDADDA